MKLNWYLKHHHHDYYSLVEPYRVNGKNRHRRIYYFGKLNPEDVQKINLGFDVIKQNKIKTINIEDIIFENHWRYLDVAFQNFIWNQWKLSDIFTYSKDKQIQTSEIAKLLVIYRCLDPGGYTSAVDWFNMTALNIIAGIDSSKVNKSKIFRELDKIEDKKNDIENYLYKSLKERDEQSMNVVFYDLTDSYFEGQKCDLAKPGITKNNGFKKKKIVLSLLVNSKGYPFAWDIIEDYTADVKTIKSLSTKWKRQFKFGDNEIILVFDRGMVSDDNLKHLEDEKYSYITALDKNQIPNVDRVDIDSFGTLTEKKMIMQIQDMGFSKYDDATYYKEIGTIDNRRHVLIFNPDMFVTERKSRNDLIQRAKAYFEEENEALSKAEKSRSEVVTKRKINNKLKKIKALRFVDYDIEAVTVLNKKGHNVSSFRITTKETGKNREAVDKAKKTDGLWMIVTNILDGEDDGKKIDAEKLISVYRDKNQIEQAFRDVKSFIKIHPFNVWEPKHVRAHYTICILSYLFDITVANRLKELDIGIKSPQKVYEVLRRGVIGKIRIKSSAETLKLVEVQQQQKILLESFQCENIIGKEYLKSMKIN